MIERLAGLQVQGRALTNFEMETAGYYAMSELLGHHCISLNALMVNRPLKTVASEGEKLIDQLIHLALNTYTR
jgi:uridine phosphorylase